MRLFKLGVLGAAFGASVCVHAVPKLEGDVADLPSGQPVDLTQEGTHDWTHWALSQPTDFNHKAGVLQQISNFTLIGDDLRRFDSASSATYSWTDGSPAPSASGVMSGAFSVVNELGESGGFEFTVKADGYERILRIYLGGFRAEGTLTATLSDGSAPTYQVMDLKGDSIFNNQVTLRYQAGGPGQTLTVRYALTSDDVPIPGGGNLRLAASTLQQSVKMDIRPFSRINFVFPRFPGIIPVALLSTTQATDGFDFDATQIDPSSVAFGPDGAAPLWGRGWVYDVNRDGSPDQIFAFGTRHTGIACGDREATLTGQTFAGDAFFGTDDIRTFGCRRRH